jgi:hypothetical protein
LRAIATFPSISQASAAAPAIANSFLDIALLLIWTSPLLFTDLGGLPNLSAHRSMVTQADQYVPQGARAVPDALPRRPFEVSPLL